MVGGVIVASRHEAGGPRWPRDGGVLLRANGRPGRSAHQGLPMPEARVPAASGRTEHVLDWPRPATRATCAGPTSSRSAVGLSVALAPPCDYGQHDEFR